MKHLLSVASITALALTAGCPSDDTSSSETTGPSGTADDTAGTSAGTSTESASASSSPSTTAEDGTTTAGDTGPETCEDPSQQPFSPAVCPDKSFPNLAEAGCYEPCDGPESPCAEGECIETQINPCDCPTGENCCAACASNQWLCLPPPPPGACDEIIGTVFLSVEELECGIGPKGPVLCNWRLTFNVDGTYEWFYSDIGDNGTYICADGVITVVRNPGLVSDYDPKTQILEWDGVDYAPSEE